MRTADQILRGFNLTPPPLGSTDRYYTTCPKCSTSRKPGHQHLKCLGVTIDAKGVKFGCNHCNWQDGDFFEKCAELRRRGAVGPAKEELTRIRAEAGERERIASEDRRAKARWLWSRRQPIAGTIAEVYLQQARGYGGQLPRTLGFLPARGDHRPAMVAAFGIPDEIEPGRIEIAADAVAGVHITRLQPDGGGKAGTEQDKIMFGPSVGSPIVVAPPNDLLGLAITEGIEDALSVHEATGLGAWAAGCASRLPALAPAVPHFIESVTLLMDNDPDGRRKTIELENLLTGRGIETRRILLSERGRAAA